ncbi:MAG TPA: hypothetical protein VNH11_12760 [Pirellulales bacterium]|nr:hypothetical protein [Pirellulales bacterium]
MSTTPNPYRDWLGVESPSATPSYYDLLGLPPLESDTAKIAAAFQRQSQRLSPHLSGGDSDAAQRLLAELAEARMTLLTPTAKRAYDQALASRYQSSPESPRPPVPAAASGPGPLLPPAASAPASAGLGTPGYQQPAAPAYGGYAPAQGYDAAGGYSAGQTYPAAQGYPNYPTAQGYPAAAYPAWQPQMAAPVAAPAYASGPYYAAPQAAAGGVVASPAAEPMPAVRRRAARRRSNATPAIAGVAVIVVAVLGGLFYFRGGEKTPAVARLNEPHQDGKLAVTEPTHGDREVAPSTPHAEPPSSPRSVNVPTKPPPDPVMPPREGTTSGIAIPSHPDTPAVAEPEPMKAEAVKPEPIKPEPAKPVSPEPDKPSEPTETKANPEEAKAVGDILRSVRAALAARDVARARDLLAEATIEATSRDTLAAVNRVEVLTDYVETFWDAVRKTLPKIELEELKIDGKVMNVVEADANHLVVRVEGRNQEYRWPKLPNNIAYHLADRWLTRDDPIRNLVLAAFEIAEPKGDRGNARSLLAAASAAKLNAQPLIDELAQPRGK